MGAPTSSVFSEIYLQSLENQEIHQLLNKHNIKAYFRYVDDILIVYDRNTSNIHDITEDFNNITPELKFTLEKETNRQINYLDITIQWTQRGFSTNIYRKPTTTVSIIPNDSCHPIGHKMAAIHYLYDRMNTHQLSQSAVKQENTITQILTNMTLPSWTRSSIRKNHNRNRTIKTTNGPNSHTPAMKPCSSPRFKKTNVKITFSTNNTVGKLLSENPEQTTSIFDKSGIYQLECPTCNMRYIGQTGRPFRTRYQEHLRDFKYNNYKSKFAQHLLEKQDAIDKMENIMNVLHITDKGQMMNTIERYYIYRETKMDNQINDKLTVQPNAIFETVVRHDTHRGLQAAHDPQTSLQNQP